MTAKSTQNQKLTMLRTLMVSTLAIATISGCSTFRHNVSDSSLDYQKAVKLEPIQLPATAQTLPFTPIYNVPVTNENTLKLSGENSKRFELPRPVTSVK